MKINWIKVDLNEKITPEVKELLETEKVMLIAGTDDSDRHYVRIDKWNSCIGLFSCMPKSSITHIASLNDLLNQIEYPGWKE